MVPALKRLAGGMLWIQGQARVTNEWNYFKNRTKATKQKAILREIFPDDPGKQSSLQLSSPFQRFHSSSSIWNNLLLSFPASSISLSWGSRLGPSKSWRSNSGSLWGAKSMLLFAPPILNWTDKLTLYLANSKLISLKDISCSPVLEGALAVSLHWFLHWAVPGLQFQPPQHVVLIRESLSF